MVELSKLLNRLLHVVNQLDQIEQELELWCTEDPKIGTVVGLVDSAHYAVETATDDLKDFIDSGPEKHPSNGSRKPKEHRRKYTDPGPLTFPLSDAFGAIKLQPGAGD